MKTSVERVDETTVKLSVTVEAARVDAAMDEAARRLAQQVKVPGFRPGRVPRRVLETRLGPGAIAQEAAREALPEFYSEAASAEQLEVVAPPEFDDVRFTSGEDAEFTATVQVRPEFEVPDYEGLQVAYPEWEVTDEEVDEQLHALRERFAELETVDRPLQAGDYAVVTISGERHGEPVEEVGAEDALYEVPPSAGTDEDDSELNRQLLGAKAGDVLKFTDTLSDDYGEELAGQEVNLTALVKEVKVKHLPELDDEFALTASEFDTIDELRDDVRQALQRQKKAYAAASLRGKVVEAVSDQVDVPVPPALVDSEVSHLLNRFAAQAQQHGMGLEAYLRAMGMQPDELLENLRQEAAKTVKAQLVVDAIGRAVEVEVGQEDLGAEIARQAARLGQPVDEIARLMTHPDRLPALVADAYRRKTIDHLVEHVTVLGGPPPEEEDGPGPEAAGASEGEEPTEVEATADQPGE